MPKKTKSNTSSSSRSRPTEDTALVQVKHTYYFRDGRRKIDAILVYKTEQDNAYRDTFIENLKHKNLELEFELSSYKTTTTFIKVHAPTATLLKNASKYDIPIKYLQTTTFPEPKVKFKFMTTILNDPIPDPNDPECKRAPETILKKKPTDFTASERSAIVFTIMRFTKYGEDPFEVGLPQLLHQGVFTAAYPLHDGPWEWPESDSEPLNDRQLLAKYWANFKMWKKQQPLNTIEKYFGNEFAMYFAWLGFYNSMLTIASVMGLITFIFGLININTLAVTPIEEVCESNMYICPMCHKCEPVKLSDFCDYFKYAYINDNIGSVIFACLMSFWATLFMELWKREQATLSLKWNIDSHVEIEHRPEFNATAKHIRKHKYTGEIEKYIPTNEIYWSLAVSIGVVVFMIIIVLAALFCIILYEVALKMNAVEKIYITLSAAILTVGVMLALRKVYGIIAIWLTDHEVPRTQMEYDKSYMLKMVIFSLVNNYGKLIYIAFFKGKFFTYPGDKNIRSNNFPMAAEICDPTGCVSELFVFLATITIFKPIFSNLVEIGEPIVKIWINRFKKKVLINPKQLTTWEQDYDLNPSDHLSIMEEFEEMVMQYGFVTMLVAAFPLAPLMALINNIFEVRIDSSKMLKYFRRTESRKYSSFTVWFDTLQAMTYLAVITNALFITFTSNFIPQLVYVIHYEHSLQGYVNFTLSEFDVVDHYWVNANISKCWYVGNRYPPHHENAYEHTYMYFYILSARLSFAIVFAILVLGLTGILAYAIPDIPKSIRDQMAYNAKKARELY